jgi:putative NIF3 family GTP cyclohydrolase 1 type 2
MLSANNGGMKMRMFLMVCALVAVDAGAQEKLTAGQVIEQIRTGLAVTFPANTVDTIKAGDASTPVTGIVTTFTPTMAVLRKAVAEHKNLIVTHEPSFYNHLDEPTLFTQDPVYLEKMAYIKEHHLVLFRLHDGWHLRQPDGIAEGWIKKAGWTKYQKPGEQMFFTLPPTTLAELARQLQATFAARILRVVGDPALRVTNVAYRPGASGEAKQVKALERDDVEVLVAGEASEWETVEYTRDAMLQGRHKALILLGHDTSEEIGMETCAEWLKKLLPAMPVEYVPAGEPYWLPEKPVTLR